MTDTVTITLPRKNLEIIRQILTFDFENVDFEDPKYDAALDETLDEIEEKIKGS